MARPKARKKVNQRRKQAQIDAMWREFQFDLVPHDRALIAAWVTAMRYSCLRTGEEETVNSYQKVAELYRRKVEELWGPLLLEFLHWVIDTTDSSQTLVLAYRDAWLLHELLPKVGTSKPLPRILAIYLNRPLLGVEDEFGRVQCASTIPDTFLYHYLAQLKDLEDGEGVLVDIGQWGTMLPRLLRLAGLRKALQARFFHSWNPWIPGFTNYRGLPTYVGVAVADSIELMPKLHQTPTGLVNTRTTGRASPRQGHQVFLAPELEETGTISQALHMQVKLGLSAPTWMRGDASRLLTKAWSWMIDAAYPQNALGDPWTSVLRQGIPPWSKGQTFLKAYPEELRVINPLELLVTNPDQARYRVRRPNNIARVREASMRKLSR